MMMMMMVMVCLTCSAPRHNQKQPTEHHQHLMSTFAKHTRDSHPCFCCVYSMHGAINAFHKRLVPTLCGAYETDKRISLPITQCAKPICPMSCNE